MHLKIRSSLLLPILILLSLTESLAQEGTIQGKVVDNGKPLHGANIYTSTGIKGTTTTIDGNFKLNLSSNIEWDVFISYVGYDTVKISISLQPGEVRTVDIEMNPSVRVLEQVEISSDRFRKEPGVVPISPRSAYVIPSAFGDFNRILATLPGVVTNNELSSAYSVRGGNYDENLIYVNGMEIYRPFLVRAGRQEGLSFINTDLVAGATFQAGGWQPAYGNRLSSVLNVEYKKPENFAGSVAVGLLGGSAHLESASKSERVQFLAGARHKQAKYLLNTFDVEGNYIPKFTDVQAFTNFNIGKENPEKTQIGLLFAYARNRYLVEPSIRETEFGTFGNALRFLVAFDGNETLDYDTWQTGINFSTRINDNFIIRSILSGVKSYEKEYSDLEGGYRLCDVDKNPGSSSFNECISIRGLGTNFFHARNTLETNMLNAELKGELALNVGYFSFGLDYAYQDFDDYLEEYRFVDSADFVQISYSINAANNTTANIAGGFVQHDIETGKSGLLIYGFRFSYRDLSSQWLLSPRAKYIYTVPGARELKLRISAGIYQQHPLYREMKDFSGNLNTSVKAQQSVHIILGLDKNFTMWERPFKLTAEGYYKYIWDAIPYDVDNVRIRYYGDNIATAYAVGFDTRVSGEFIPGAESWFSLSLLSTREKLENSETGYVRRPTDQHVTFATFFEDHLPGNPTIRVNLSLVYGSGLPFGPPGNFQNRSVFNGPSYQRVDVGFSKIFLINSNWNNSVWLTFEILNLLGAQNTISYTWIEDVSGRYIAIPNTLSNRFFNMKLAYRFNSSAKP